MKAHCWYGVRKRSNCAEKGIDPFGTTFDASGSIAQIRAEDYFKAMETMRVAGRITAHRDMGKSHFLRICMTRQVTCRFTFN